MEMDKRAGDASDTNGKKDKRLPRVHRNGGSDHHVYSNNTNEDSNSINAQSNFAKSEFPLEEFLRNVQVMLLNFHTQGYPVKDVHKLYKKVFSTEALPNPHIYGFPTIEALLRSSFIRPYCLIFAYKGDAKPDLIRAKSLSLSSYFMLKKGHDIVRIVRRSSESPPEVCGPEPVDMNNELLMSEQSNNDLNESENELNTMSKRENGSLPKIDYDAPTVINKASGVGRGEKRKKSSQERPGPDAMNGRNGDIRSRKIRTKQQVDIPLWEHPPVDADMDYPEVSYQGHPAGRAFPWQKESDATMHENENVVGIRIKKERKDPSELCTSPDEFTKSFSRRPQK